MKYKADIDFSQQSKYPHNLSFWFVDFHIIIKEEGMVHTLFLY